MRNVNNSTKKLAGYSGEDEELPFEFHITGTIKPGDDDGHPRYRITDVIVSPTDEDDLDHDVDGEDEVEEDEPVVRINKLRHKENVNTERSIVKKKRSEEPDDDDDDDGYNEHPELDDTEDLDPDEDDDDGDRTIMSCIQKSILRRR